MLLLSLFLPWEGSARPIDDRMYAQDSPYESRLSVTYICHFEGTVLDRVSQQPVANASVVFYALDDSAPVTVSSRQDGRYYAEVACDRYTYVARHPGYALYTSAPSSVELKAPYVERIGIWGGMFRERIVTEESFREIDIYLNKRPQNVLLVTTSRLDTTEEFNNTLNAYIDVLRTTEDLAAHYVVLDSTTCQDRYGVRVSDPNNWRQIRDALTEIIDQTGSAYVVLLGGLEVVPRPGDLAHAWVSDGILFNTLFSDAWYADFDDDGVVDGSVVVSRLPEVGTSATGIEAALNTAIALHESGGYQLRPMIRFSRQCWADRPIGLGSACDDDDPVCGFCYDTPPYGVCEQCDRINEFRELMSTARYVQFAGHGNSTGFFSETDSDGERHTKFTIEHMDEINLDTPHPVMTGYFACNTAVVRSTQPTLATELMRAGAAAFVGRTTTMGIPNLFAGNFEPYIEGREPGAPYRIGDALYDLMREVATTRPGGDEPNVLQINMYGDPTLKRRWRMMHGLEAPIIKQ